MEPFYKREPWRSVILAILTALLTIVGGQTVGYFGCVPWQAPPEPKKEKDRSEPPLDPKNAICKVILSRGYCSGTIVGPPRPDQRHFLVSAAHCFSQKGVGEKATIVTRTGITFTATVTAINRQADCAILLADYVVPNLPYTTVASEIPPVGSKVWHAGYGFDKPGNREEGVILSGEDPHGQIRYRLSVSHGDSGGGIIYDQNGQLLSPVCCTTDIARVGTVWGASPHTIRRMLRDPTLFVDVPPVPVPLRESTHGNVPTTGKVFEPSK